MRCDSWLCWEGWTAVGSIAGVLALFALAFAIYEILLRRKRVRPVVWGFDLFGTLSDGVNSYHTAELHNGGTGTATINTLAFVGARPVPIAEHRFRSVVGPGERMVIPLSAARLTDAWFVIIWTEDADATLYHVEWLRVTHTGSIADNWRESLARTRALGRLRDVPRGRRPRPVGPGYYQSSSFKWSSNEALADARHKTTWAGILAVGKTMYAWSYAPTDPVRDLPYVTE